MSGEGGFTFLGIRFGGKKRQPETTPTAVPPIPGYETPASRPVSVVPPETQNPSATPLLDAAQAQKTAAAASQPVESPFVQGAMNNILPGKILADPNSDQSKTKRSDRK